MGLPAGVRLHRPTGTDEDAVTALLVTTACQVADTGRSDRELADILEDWGRPGVELAHDAWLARDGAGETVAYALAAPPDAEACAEAEICVHPRARGMGLGSHLRELVEARARARGAGALRQRVPTGNRMAERPLERSGYRPTGHSWRLERPLDVAPPRPAWPTGATPAELGGDRELAAVLALLERAGARDPHGEPLALDRFHAERLADERLDRGLCALARRGDRLAGVAIGESWNDADGVVAQLAVDPGEPDRDALAHALLLEAFARMRARGLGTVVVPASGAGPDPPAPFAAVGLRPAWQQTTWRKRLAL